ncbi:spore coat protein GerQ [Effusibacillus pohliae]|uniref:spore coat protein GerQ n=1 Tax=Effusibacillus pohliae TaxID=232270 RepID=UPI000376DE5A|nr:spore coat protein GerQ [Effusibacillus pohliae]
MYYWTPDYRQVTYPYYPYYQYGIMQQPAVPPTAAPEYGPPIPSGKQLPTAAPTGVTPTPLPMYPGADEQPIPGLEESYIENILRFNRGKIGTFYMTFENNTQWNAKVFRGRIETAGRDHIIISDPQTGKRYLLQMINLDWVEFDEPLAYIPPRLPPFVQQQLTTGVPGVAAPAQMARD